MRSAQEKKEYEAKSTTQAFDNSQTQSTTVVYTCDARGGTYVYRCMCKHTMFVRSNAMSVRSIAPADWYSWLRTHHQDSKMLG